MTRRGLQDSRTRTTALSLRIVVLAAALLGAQTLLAAPAPAASRAQVIEHWPGAPIGGTPHETDLAPFLTSSSRLRGNLVHAFADLNDDGKAQPNEEVPPSGGSDWLYPFSPFGQTALCLRLTCSWDGKKAFSWQTNMRQQTVQAFYFVNTYYSNLIRLGFTEAAGNFQQVNATGKGKPRDPILVRVDAGANKSKNGVPDAEHLNNAHMATDPDGKPGDLDLLLNSKEGYYTSSGDDAPTLYHEVTHGLVSRLVVDKDGGGTMTAGQGGAMNEGFADWFAFSYLNGRGFVPDSAGPGEVRMFVAETPDRKGIRTQPLDCPVGAAAGICPGAAKAGSGGYTYGDYGRVYTGGPEVHADGEIWAETLWDLRNRFVVTYGPAGIERLERLVISALKVTVPFPSYLDMRNALLRADKAAGGADQAAIWEVFAARGMGFFASTGVDPNDPNPAQNFSTPPPPGSPEGKLRGTVHDSVTGKPIKRVVLLINGQLFSARTDEQGRFTISGMPAGTYALVEAIKAGYDEAVARKLKIKGAGTANLALKLARDWAAELSGGRIARFTGTNEGAKIGCGTAAVIAQDDESWLTEPPKKGKSSPSVTVKLPRSLDISSFGVDPGATCSQASELDASSSTGGFNIEVSRNGRDFTSVVAGRFTNANNARINTVKPSGGKPRGVRYVRFTIRGPQGPLKGVKDDPGVSFKEIWGLGELEVYGRPAR